MDSKKLDALVTAVELGSFTQAAAQLGYTQSGMTHMMNSLEKELGFAVLVRSRSGVHLTAAGERVFPLVKDCLRSQRMLEREIRMVNSRKEDAIRVASYGSIATHWLPAVIRQFRTAHKEISVDLQVGSVEEVFRAVREGRVDVAFTSRRDCSDLDWLPLKNDPLLAVLPLDYDVQGADSFPMEAFSGRDFFLPAMGFEVDILPPLSRRGVTPNIQNVQVGDSAVISLVEQGLGLSILSELVLTGRRDAVQALPLSPPAARELGIAYRGNEPLSPLTRQFMRLAREIIQNL